jgi:hypothetical protein
MQISKYLGIRRFQYKKLIKLVIIDEIHKYFLSEKKNPTIPGKEINTLVNSNIFVHTNYIFKFMNDCIVVVLFNVTLLVIVGYFEYIFLKNATPYEISKILNNTIYTIQ